MNVVVEIAGENRLLFDVIEIDQYANYVVAITRDYERLEETGVYEERIYYETEQEAEAVYRRIVEEVEELENAAKSVILVRI